MFFFSDVLDVDWVMRV